jgi:hypothetical protein
MVIDFITVWGYKLQKFTGFQSYTSSSDKLSEASRKSPECLIGHSCCAKGYMLLFNNAQGKVNIYICSYDVIQKLIFYIFSYHKETFPVSVENMTYKLQNNMQYID